MSHTPETRWFFDPTLGLTGERGGTTFQASHTERRALIAQLGGRAPAKDTEDVLLGVEASLMVYEKLIRAHQRYVDQVDDTANPALLGAALDTAKQSLLVRVRAALGAP